MFRFRPTTRAATVMAAAACAWLVLAAAAEACPMCKETLSSHRGGGDVVRGYFYSILFMLSMPFLILGGLGSLMYREVRRARKAQGIDQHTA